MDNLNLWVFSVRTYHSVFVVKILTKVSHPPYWGWETLVIYPQEAAPFRDGDGSLLKITKQDKESYFKAPDMQTDGKALDRFEAGKQITVKLSLNESTDSKWANKKNNPA